MYRSKIKKKSLMLLLVVEWWLLMIFPEAALDSFQYALNVQYLI